MICCWIKLQGVAHRKGDTYVRLAHPKKDDTLDGETCAAPEEQK